MQIKLIGKFYFFLCICFINLHADENTDYLKSIVLKLSTVKPDRSINNIEELNKIGEFIVKELEGFQLKPYKQEYPIGTSKAFNVLIEFGDKSKPCLVIGAHYDSCGGTPGADDNASGVACILLMAKLLQKDNQKNFIQFAFYSTEEPPFFRTDKMGSAKHVEKIKIDKTKIKGMICLEMLGYYSEEKGSQEYPSDIMKMLYPDKGNFIGLISNADSASFLKEIDAVFKTENNIPSISLVAPEFLAGVDFSDHLNFWKHKHKAVMITDTAFYRNKHYHKSTDTHEKLNYENIKKIADNLIIFINISEK